MPQLGCHLHTQGFLSFYFDIHTLAYHNYHALVLDCRIPIIRNFEELIYGCSFGIYLTIVPKTILIIWLSLDILERILEILNLTISLLF